MLDFGFWYDVATYANIAWKGSFTKKEVAQNAYDYTRWWDWSVQSLELTYNISKLVELLTEDGSEEASEFVEEIQKECKRFHIL